MGIKRVTLQTNKLEEMKQFYGGTLGFALLEEQPDRFHFKIGESTLEFSGEQVSGEPYYHFAFTIPADQFKEAKAWTQGKATLLREDGEDEVFFSNLNAHSCYFEDPAGNIVELIARNQPHPLYALPFSGKNMLTISEIGLVVKDPQEAGKRFIEAGIFERERDPISSTSLNFMEVETNRAFILLAGPGRRWLFSEKISKVFPINIKLTNNLEVGVDETGEFYMNPGLENYHSEEE